MVSKYLSICHQSCCHCSVIRLCPAICDLLNCSTPCFPGLHSQNSLKLMSINSVMLSNHLILCHPLLLRPFRYDLNQIPYEYTVEVTNRFTELDLIECLKNYGWRFMTLYRKPWSKPSPRKRKANWLSDKALQIAEERRDAKGKGEKERYTKLNAEFQRIGRRDKKAFLSNQCKEIEEKNRMGNTRDLFKKIRDTKGTFHTKMGTIKNRNGMDLTEAEDIKKR